MLRVSQKRKKPLRKENFVLWFDDLKKEDIPIVGGKNANLGEMLYEGIPVPPGFAVTAYAYKTFITETKIEEEIYNILKENIKGLRNPQQLEKASRRIRKLRKI